MSQVLGLEDWADGHVMQADVLPCRAQNICTGVGPVGECRVGLDVGMICLEAAGHSDNATGDPLGAASDYVKTQCGRGGMYV